MLISRIDGIYCMVTTDVIYLPAAVSSTKLNVNFVEARTNMSKEAPLPFLGYGILILLGVSGSSSIVTCSD